jgi:hypothetical protein
MHYRNTIAFFTYFPFLTLAYCKAWGSKSREGFQRGKGTPYLRERGIIYHYFLNYIIL